MILDKLSKSRVSGRRSQAARRQPPVADRKAQARPVSRFSMIDSQFSLRRGWVRLILLLLMTSALTTIGAAIGRGFGTNDVMTESISPTATTLVSAEPAASIGAPATLATLQPV